jgi:hypothetical protein
MVASRARPPTDRNSDVRTPEIGGISHSDWDPAEEDWGRGRPMGAPGRTIGTPISACTQSGTDRTRSSQGSLSHLSALRLGFQLRSIWP